MEADASCVLREIAEIIECVWTRVQMLDQAVQEQLGTGRSLAVTFDNWRKIGLLPPFTEKEHRRGGAGLWPHPVIYPWLGMLRNRLEGRRVSTLANITVFCWLVECPGFETATARRAFSYWVDRHGEGRPRTGERSLRERVLRQMVEDMSWNQAPPQAKRGLQNRLRILADGIAAGSAQPSRDLIDDVRSVLPSDAPDDYVRWLAYGIHQDIRLQLCAQPYLTVLREDRRDVLAFWEWSAGDARGTIFPMLPYPAPEEVVPLQEQTPDQQQAFAQDFERTTNRACRDLMVVFGIGLRALGGGGWYSDVQAPPRLEGVGFPPAWAEIDEDLLGRLASDAIALAAKPMPRRA